MSGLYRAAQGMKVSSIGIGTYLGAMDDRTDESYRASVVEALRGGINVIDTSLNYRHQRSEIAIGRALRDWKGPRDEYVVCTKAGYLVPGAMPELNSGDIVSGMHSMAPEFLDDQLERSRANLGLDTVDVFYLHNPETQWGHVREEEFYARIRRAFEFCETAVAQSRIRYYGVATWEAFRRGPKSVSVRRLESLAREVGGSGHRFRFIQMPFNLAMTEGLTKGVEDGRGAIPIAVELGITVVASASLLQSRLSKGLPEQLSAVLGGRTDAQRAIQFTRSAPGITVALVGMSRPEHVRENLEVAWSAPLNEDEFHKLSR